MGYPLILAHDGSEFARLNYDGSWTLNTPSCLVVAGESLNSKNRLVVALATLLYEVYGDGKLNESLTSWSDSDENASKWSHSSRTIDLARADNDMTENSLFGITEDGAMFVKLRLDSSWIIEWDTVEEVANQDHEDSWRNLTKICFCRLLMLAKDELCETTRYVL